MKILEGKEIYTIAEINQGAKQVLEELIFWVEGEISSIQTDPKWFNTFISLKDGSDLLTCFIEALRFNDYQNLKVGDKILAYGNLTLFKKNEYKFKIVTIKQSGEGILQKKFKELYEKLKAEGLFAQSNKKPIPQYPKKVCVVTSEGSAGWNDFKAMSVGKFPIIELSTLDITVGGPKAISELITFLPLIDKQGFDVVVITRGGGAEETLMEVFNDENVARTIFKMKTPKIVAIGHEINVSLSELAADRRASTPTDAANIVVSGYSGVLEKLDNFEFYLNSKSQRLFLESGQLLDSIYQRLSQVKNSFKDLPHRLNTLESFLEKHEQFLIHDADTRCNELFKSLAKNLMLISTNKTQQLEQMVRSMQILSPENTLKRGYSITYDNFGNVIKTIDDIELQGAVGVKLHDGAFKAKITSKQKNG